MGLGKFNTSKFGGLVALDRAANKSKFFLEGKKWSILHSCKEYVGSALMTMQSVTAVQWKSARPTNISAACGFAVT
jgi:hypothetical protein